MRGLGECLRGRRWPFQRPSPEIRLGFFIRPGRGTLMDWGRQTLKIVAIMGSIYIYICIYIYIWIVGVMC